MNYLGFLKSDADFLVSEELILWPPVATFGMGKDMEAWRPNTRASLTISKKYTGKGWRFIFMEHLKKEIHGEHEFELRTHMRTMLIAYSTKKDLSSFHLS